MELHHSNPAVNSRKELSGSIFPPRVPQHDRLYEEADTWYASGPGAHLCNLLSSLESDVGECARHFLACDQNFGDV
jgi:hypothetical protein